MTDNNPLYRRCTHCTRLYRSDASDQAAAAGYWAGWLASSGPVADPIPLDLAWADAAGTLLFLPTAPVDASTFEADLIAYLAGSPVGFRPRALWLSNPLAPPVHWLSSELTLGSDGKLSAPLEFKFADYQYRIAAGASFVLQTGGNDTAHFKSEGDGIQLQAPRARFTLGSTTLPMAGAQLGAWQGAMNLDPASTSNLETLGVLLRYARLQPRSTDLVESVDMPILSQLQASCALTLGLDPLLPLDPARTAMRFADQPELQSGWATTLGHEVRLTPQTAPAGGLPPAGLVFAATPRRLSDATAGSKYHLAPVGAFALDTAPPTGLRASLPITADGTQEQLMLGLAGTEYLGLAPGGTTIAVFVGAQPALLKADTDAAQGPLSPAAQTSWASFVDRVGQSSGMAYYAQPERSPLYAAADSTAVLDFKAVLSGRLAAGAGEQAVATLTTMPVGAYRGVNRALVARARAIELAGLAPVRRQAIPSAAALQASGQPSTRAVTPPGLVADVDDTRFERVIIGNLPLSSTPEVAFEPINPDFQLALQSNQLFFVVADPAALGPQAGLKVELSRWVFQLNPASWRSDLASPTLLLFKFAARTLVELVADPASWGWKAAASRPGGSITDTSTTLTKLFQNAAAAPAGSPYRSFYDEVANNPNWSGVLFMNAAIDAGELDPQLGFITAGVDLQRFYAHHIGFSLTPYTLDPDSKKIALQQTAAFGLVDYQDRRDLNITKTVPFAYKTLALTAVFSNAALSSFSAEVELLTNQLFGTELAKLDPDRGNNLVLAGSYHTVDGTPAYAFDLIGRNVYATASGALNEVEVQTVSLQTETAGGGALTTRFSLTGNLRFNDNLDYDLFAWGPALDGSGVGHLRYANLVVRMHSQRDGSGEVRFDNLESALSFDLANSVPRPQSLIAKFPVTLNGFVAVPAGEEAPGPDKLGYASIAMPLDQSVLTGPWFGLTYTLQLGTLGNLAGSVGLSIQMLTAWAPASDGQGAGIYLGLKVPGLNDLGIQWPLQGVLSFGFRSFEMQRYTLPDTNPAEYGYLMRLHRLALSFLGFSVPPGNTDVVLFGNPKEGAKGPLGWYAAYAKDLPAKKKSGESTLRALRSGPRADVARLRRERGGSHTP
jgi:hypothetical protein